MPGQISLDMIDGEGQTYPMVYYVNGTLSVAEAQSVFEALVPIARGISDAGVLRGRVSFELPLPVGLVGAAIPGANSRVDYGATLSLANEVNRAFSHYVPAFKASKLVNKLVVATDADVVAYVDALISGVASKTFGDENFLDLTTLRRGIQSVRKLRR